MRCLSVADEAINRGATWPLQAHRVSDVTYPSRKTIALKHDVFTQPDRRDWSGLLDANARYNALSCDCHVQYVGYDMVLPSTKQDLLGFEHHDPNYTPNGMAGAHIH